MNDQVLRIQNLKKHYQQGGAEIPVLKGIDLALAQGESLAIVGQSGSGKSTLLSLLAGLDRPSDGGIHLAGQDIVNLGEENLAAFRRQHIGIIFQQFHLMSSLSALENISLPLEIAKDPGHESKAREALRLVGLDHRSSHFPHQMSGGECQRVAIARALVVRPTVLLADEPSGNLDDETGNRVMDLLFSLVKKERRSMILVTHDAELAQRCDRVLTLRHGILN